MAYCTEAKRLFSHFVLSDYLHRISLFFRLYPTANARIIGASWKKAVKIKLFKLLLYRRHQRRLVKVEE